MCDTERIELYLQQPDQRDLRIGLDKKSRHFVGYYNIARHYKFALDHVLTVMNFTSAIIIEGLFVVLFTGTCTLTCSLETVEKNLLLSNKFDGYIVFFCFWLSTVDYAGY